ncbi:DNA-binding HxlR family transcriptional regulator [Rhodopirellula rubra]|uniref:DNA-binding HxlR family transcriptional regulator n=1 Tax=Aporhodopirellula rubra TaxID=980271 RepID=A0A7W5H8S0_9BACT|nr:helix-turn-helix domain-containing protein [Aporhodopirellula rubra]MBB3209316.1 DNA-binding HxlR family transcriptional regulator [Aporhodopirellula rubra]
MDTNEEKTPKAARHVNYELPACPVEATLELIGAKWKGIILFYLLDGRVRFSELKRLVGCVTQRMLTKQLRDLEAGGLVNRIVYAEVPPRVEYELTEEGRSLEPILHALKDWGEQHAMKLIAARHDAESLKAENPNT